MKRVHLIFLALILIMNAGCSSSRKYVNFSDDDVNYAVLDSYTIGVGDQLDIRVWRNEELSVSVPVRPDGKISTPLVGDVMAAGKQVPDLSREIEKALATFVRSPEVTVIVTEAHNSEFINRIRITGSVVTPMSVAYSEGMTVLDLVLLAGGPTEFANTNAAKLYRTTSSGVKVYDIYLKDILAKGDLRSNYNLRPADILTIPEALF